MISGILLALAIAPPRTPDSLLVRGRALENRYATVSIPALRLGARIGDDGRFTLRLAPSTECRELVLSYMRLEVIVRFQPAKGDTLVDLGALVLPVRQSYSALGVDPLLSDTVGTCVPNGGPWPRSWVGAEGIVRGVVTRDGRPLRKAPIDIGCNYVAGSGPGETDSTGAFSLTLQAHFPDVLYLVDSRAACQLRTGAPFDSPLPLDVRLGRPGEPPPVTFVDWKLPGPIVTAGDTIVSPGDRREMRHFQDAVGFSAFVEPAAPFLRIAIVKRSPRVPKVYGGATCGLPPGPNPVASYDTCIMVLERRDTLAAAQLLPWAILVSTGYGATSWAEVAVNLPAAYVKRLEAGEKARVYWRVSPRYTSDPDTFIPVESRWDRALQLLSIKLLMYQFDDQRSPRHENESLLVVGIGSE